MFYPKINSLYKREGCGPYDEKQKRYVSDLKKKPRVSPLIIGEYACDEFANIKHWTITEKIDGTNTRITLDKHPDLVENDYAVRFGGRTANSQIPVPLLSYLQDVFTLDKMQQVFADSKYVVLFGEGYGGKIQSVAGSYYRKDSAFILFDVYCSGWWLERERVKEIAQLLGVESAPVLYHKPCDAKDLSFTWTIDEIVEFIKTQPSSLCTQVASYTMEGIIARSHPLMLFRDGKQMMFKLKCCDFEKCY